MNCKEETYMKKLKSILALMIATVIMCLSISSIFAVEVNEELYEANKKLFILCWESVYDYGVGANKRGCYFYTAPGERVPSIEGESYLRAQAFLHEADDLINRYAVDNQTVEQYEELYDKFYNALNSLVLSKGMLKELISFCSEEENYNGYYSDELWSEFCDKLDNAKAVYADPNNTKDFIVTEAYFELLHSHFKLCASNTMYGDVDNDSKITIMDATYVQMVCAKLRDFNSSQYLIAKKDVAYASEIQRYISSITENIVIENSKLDTYIDYVDYSDIHSENFRFKSWKYNYHYINYTTPTPVSYPTYLDDWLYG